MKKRGYNKQNENKKNGGITMKKIILGLCVLATIFSLGLASGTGAGTQITAVSTNVLLTFDDGVNQYQSTAASYNVADVTSSIGEIHGLYENAIDLTALGTLSGGAYKNLATGTTYNISFQYLNRGNITDNIEAQVSLVQAASRWVESHSGSTTINEDQLVSLNVAINPATAIAYERCTMNITCNIVSYGSKNVVSYNVLPSVVSSDIQGGAYGGSGYFTHLYLLEAEGVSLSIISKTVSWNYPTGYTGTTATPMPGSKMTYTVVVKNNKASQATSVNLTDTVPDSCHLYYTSTPTVVGAVAYNWLGSTSNTADKNTANAIKFEITLAGNATITANYSVTVD